MGERIVANRIQCRHCEDIIESMHRHDFVRCSCGKVFVDGGRDYLRRGYDQPGDYYELSESEEDDLGR